MEGHPASMVVSPRRYQRRPVSILRLLLLFSVKRAPTGETVANSAHRAFAFSRIKDLSGEEVFSSRILEAGRGREVLPLSRGMIYSRLVLLNSHSKLAAISWCVRHLDASMNQIRSEVRIG